MGVTNPISKEEHIECHIKLHKALDELVGDWITHTNNMPSSSTVFALMKWSFEQTKNPTTRDQDE